MDKDNKKGSEHPLNLLATEAYKAFSDLGFEYRFKNNY